jgi:hypothetical protein
MKKTNTQIAEVVKTLLVVIITASVVYGLVIVPSINLANNQASFERAEARVHFSCDLLARNNTVQAVEQNEGEEATDEEVQGFFAQQYQNCVQAEGLSPQDLVDKFVPQTEGEEGVAQS